jgi:hypothetical protein
MGVQHWLALSNRRFHVFCVMLSGNASTGLYRRSLSGLRSTEAGTRIVRYSTTIGAAASLNRVLAGFVGLVKDYLTAFRADAGPPLTLQA